MTRKRPVHKSWYDRFFGYFNKVSEKQAQEGTGHPWDEFNGGVDFPPPTIKPFPKIDLTDLYQIEFDILDRSKDKVQNGPS